LGWVHDLMNDHRTHFVTPTFRCGNVLKAKHQHLVVHTVEMMICFVEQMACQDMIDAVPDYQETPFTPEMPADQSLDSGISDNSVSSV